MTERLRSGNNFINSANISTKMSNDLTPRKTMLILVIVVGCFAVLWPKVFYPMLVGSANQHIKPSPIDKTTGCCDVISELDVNTIKIMSELCKTIIKNNGDDPLTGKEVIAKCQAAVLDTCGIDISAVLQQQVRLGQTVKQILDEVRSLNGSLCLKYNFGVAPWTLGVPHRVTVKSSPSSIRQERPPHLRSELVHPAFRERGRAIPQSQATSQRSTARVVEGRPGPIPGLRPTLGGPGHVVPPPKQGTGSMGLIMPIYTIGIVIFFTYTVMKIIFKKQPEALYPPVEPDPNFRREVFESERGQAIPKLTREGVSSKLVVNAMSALLDEVDQEIESRRIASRVAEQNVVANGNVCQEEEQPSVKVLGMEMTASCESGEKWSRPHSPVLPAASAPPQEPSEPPQEIFLEGALPAQSHLLVADSATEAEKTNSEEDPAVVLAGKMTLSVISLDSSENGSDESSNLIKSSSSVSDDFEKVETGNLDRFEKLIDIGGSVQQPKELETIESKEEIEADNIITVDSQLSHLQNVATTNTDQTEKLRNTQIITEQISQQNEAIITLEEPLVCEEIRDEPSKQNESSAIVDFQKGEEQIGELPESNVTIEKSVEASITDITVDQPLSSTETEILDKETDQQTGSSAAVEESVESHKNIVDSNITDIDTEQPVGSADAEIIGEESAQQITSSVAVEKSFIESNIIDVKTGKSVNDNDTQVIGEETNQQIESNLVVEDTSTTDKTIDEETATELDEADTIMEIINTDINTTESINNIEIQSEQKTEQIEANIAIKTLDGTHGTDQPVSNTEEEIEGEKVQSIEAAVTSIDADKIVVETNTTNHFTDAKIIEETNQEAIVLDKKSDGTDKVVAESDIIDITNVTKEIIPIAVEIATDIQKEKKEYEVQNTTSLESPIQENTTVFTAMQPHIDETESAASKLLTSNTALETIVASNIVEPQPPISKKSQPETSCTISDSSQLSKIDKSKSNLQIPQEKSSALKKMELPIEFYDGTESEDTINRGAEAPSVTPTSSQAKQSFEKLNEAVSELSSEFTDNQERSIEKVDVTESDNDEEIEYEYEDSDNEEIYNIDGIDDELVAVGASGALNGENQEQSKYLTTSSATLAENDVSDDDVLENEEGLVDVQEIIEYITDEEEEVQYIIPPTHANNTNHIPEQHGPQ